MYSLPVLNGFASQIAGTSVVISCDRQSTFPPGWLGDVVWGADGKLIPVIHLPVATCSDLEHADTGNVVVPADFLVLEHEAAHIALESGDECVVEKQAFANAWQLIRLFKLAAWRTRAILAGLPYVDSHLAPAYHEGC